MPVAVRTTALRRNRFGCLDRFRVERDEPRQRAKPGTGCDRIAERHTRMYYMFNPSSVCAQHTCPCFLDAHKTRPRGFILSVSGGKKRKTAGWAPVVSNRCGALRFNFKVMRHFRQHITRHSYTHTLASCLPLISYLRSPYDRVERNGHVCSTS